MLVELKKNGFTEILKAKEVPIDLEIEKEKGSSYLRNEYKPISSKIFFKERVRYLKQNVKNHGILSSLFQKCKANICIIQQM